MDVALSRRLARALQHEADIEEQDSVVEEAQLVDTWEQLPQDIRELIEDLEDRPYREGVPYAWLGDPRETEKAWALEAQSHNRSMTASAGDYHEEFCRNPLHPGPCKGWRQALPEGDSRRRPRKDVAPAESSRRRKREVTQRLDTKAVEDELRRIQDTAPPSVLPPDAAQAAYADLQAAAGGDTGAQERITALARTTYEYQDDGVDGLQAIVRSVVPSRGTSNRGAGMTVSVEILDRQGRHVGMATRSWRVPPGSDKVQVRHSSFSLNDNVQGGGFSRRYNARAYQAYREMGVGRVGLTADDTVGGAAWALEGYDWTDQADLEAVANRWRRVHGRLQPGPIRDQINELLLRTRREDWDAGRHPSPYEFAMIGSEFTTQRPIRGTNRTYTSWIGKEVMAQTEWEGALGITEPNRPEANPPGRTAAAEPDMAGWDERTEFLQAVNELALAYANTVAEDVAAEDLYDPPGDYPEHHHLFAADEETSDVYTDLADDLMSEWGRDQPDTEEDDPDALVAHAGCAEFCRAPLHPGPCRGWRSRLRQKNPERARKLDERDRAQREGRTPAKKAPAKKAAPAAPTETPQQRQARLDQEQLETARLGAEAQRQRELLRTRPMERVSPEGYSTARFQDDLYVAARAQNPRGLTQEERTRAAEANQRLTAWARAVWQHDDPQSGLRAEVQYVTASAPYGQPDRPNMQINLVIRDARGRQVGTSTRQVGVGVLASGGRDTLQAYHAFLRLDPSVQGGGFADRYNARAYQAYAEMGVTRVGVHADIDVGGYTWATQGFDFETRRDLDGFVSRATSVLRYGNPDPATRAEAQRLIDRSTEAHWRAGTHPTPYEFAMLGREQVSLRQAGRNPDGTVRHIVTWPGKDMLLGSSWHGVRPITLPVRRGGPSPFTRAGRPRKAAKKAVTAAAEAPMVEEFPEDPSGPGWDDRAGFLDAVGEWASAWANTVGDTVPVHQEDAHPNRDGETDYYANQHLISASPAEQQAFLDIAEEVLAEWGRDDQGEIPLEPEADEQPGGVTASGEPTAPFPGPPDLLP